MANGEITITILGEGGAGDGGATGKKEKTPADLMREGLNKVLHPLRTAQEAVKDVAIDLLGGSGGATAAVGIGAKVLSDALAMAYSIAMMEHNRYFTLTEDYLGQNKMNVIQTQIGTAKSMLSSIGSGAAAGMAAGMAGGPVAMAIGTVIGAITSGAKAVITTKMQTDQKVEQHNMQLNAINAQTNFMASRASLVNGGRGTEY